MGDRRTRCRSLAREIPELYWGRIMPGGRPPAFNPFTCPSDVGRHLNAITRRPLIRLGDVNILG
jgi:hypothetical protein